MTTDVLDYVTWVQYRDAFKIATAALLKIASGAGDPQATATDALQVMAACVHRFDDSEPSWEPPG